MKCFVCWAEIFRYFFTQAPSQTRPEYKLFSFFSLSFNLSLLFHVFYLYFYTQSLSRPHQPPGSSLAALSQHIFTSDSPRDQNGNYIENCKIPNFP